MKDRILQVRIDNETFDRIRKESEKSGINKSKVLREIIKYYFDNLGVNAMVSLSNLNKYFENKKGDLLND